jgi:hypothetical protein
VETAAENASACPEFEAGLETANEVSLEQSPKEDWANVQAEYLGPPRQGREGLQRAIDAFIATETEGDSYQSPERQAHSSCEEDSHLQLPDWQDDESDSTNSDPHATVDQGMAANEKGKATGYDWQEEDYVTREEWSDMA